MTGSLISSSDKYKCFISKCSKYGLQLVLIFAMFFGAADAQIDKTLYYSFGKKFYTEAFVQPAGSADSIDVVIIVRLAYDAISFMQEIKHGNSKQFSGVANIEVSFRDEIGVIRKRVNWRDTVIVDNYESTNSKDSFITGVLNITLHSGQYTVTSEILDDFKKNIKKQKFKIGKASFASSETIADDIFVYKKQVSGEEIILPYALGDNIDFTSFDPIVFVSVSYGDSPGNYFYSVVKTESKDKTIGWDKEINLSGLTGFLPNRKLIVVKSNSVSSFETVEYNEKNNNIPNGQHQNNFGLLEIVLPSNELVPGNYELLVFKDGGNDTLRKEFSVIWVNKPLSMKDINYATELMYYLLTDDEYDIMRDGSKKEMARKFHEYWKSKDPTPATPFNEAMSTYFKRVDHSYFNFQTISEKDGAKTDRGKIYILYGAPDSVATSLENGNSREVWVYERLKKEFIFETIAVGIYKLVDIKK